MAAATITKGIGDDLAITWALPAGQPAGLAEVVVYQEGGRSSARSVSVSLVGDPPTGEVIVRRSRFSTPGTWMVDLQWIDSDGRSRQSPVVEVEVDESKDSPGVTEISVTVVSDDGLIVSGRQYVEQGDDVTRLGSGEAAAGQVPIADGEGGIAWGDQTVGEHTHEISDVNGLEAALASKASQSDLTALTGVVGTKAAQSDLDNLALTVASKADAADLDAKADKTALDALSDEVYILSGEVDNKAAQDDLDDLALTVASKAAQADLDDLALTVASKANTSDVLAALSTKVNTSAVGAANGVAPTDANNKIPSSYLPSIAINTAQVAASEAEMLALTAEVGDIAIRTDLSSSRFILVGDDPTLIANWVELTHPTDTITGVFGRVGDVVAEGGDYAAFYLRHDALQTLDSTQLGRLWTNLGLGTAAGMDAGVANGTGSLGADGKQPIGELAAHSLRNHSDVAGTFAYPPSLGGVWIWDSGEDFLGNPWAGFTLRRLTAADIYSGTFSADRIPTLAQNKVTDLEADLAARLTAREIRLTVASSSVGAAIADTDAPVDTPVAVPGNVVTVRANADKAGSATLYLYRVRGGVEEEIATITFSASEHASVSVTPTSLIATDHLRLTPAAGATDIEVVEIAIGVTA